MINISILAGAYRNPIQISSIYVVLMALIAINLETLLSTLNNLLHYSTIFPNIHLTLLLSNMLYFQADIKTN